MPAFRDSATTTAPPEEVWKILYDPGRFPEWWTGVGSVETGGRRRLARRRTRCTPTATRTSRCRRCSRAPATTGTVSVSCLVSDLRFAWRLEPAGAGTRIAVEVEIPEAEAHRLDGQREAIASALRRLAAVAAAEAPVTPPSGGPPPRR